MQRLFIVHGMKRSGNHAIINWIKAHGQFIFINNAIPVTAEILRGQEEIPPPTEFTQWMSTRIFPRYLQPFLFFFRKVILHRRSAIIGLEDNDLPVRLFHNPPHDIINILIVRDPYNLFSSRIRRAPVVNIPEVFPKDTDVYMQRAVRLWKSHARECLGLTEFLENKVPIYFNTWFTDRVYRQQLSRELKLKFTDLGFSHVSSEGGGSSFDGTNLDGDNLRMDVLNRRSSLSDTEQRLLDETLRDDEIHELARRLES